ncbi:unnamed protein product, partial [Discosporangium mesarthrocarpum]
SQSLEAAEGGLGEEEGERGGEGEKGVGYGLDHGVAELVLERLLSSEAFSLPVSQGQARERAGPKHKNNGGEGWEGAATPDSGSLLSLNAAGGDRITDSVTDSVTGSVTDRRVRVYSRSGALTNGLGRRDTLLSAQVLDANATLVGLTIEAVGSLAEVARRGFGEPFLMRALYPLLEKVAAPHPVVAVAAVSALRRIRVACGPFNDLPGLLEANMDYIVDDVVKSAGVPGLGGRGGRRG